MAALNVTSANFEKEVMQSDKPVLIDFWAPGCAPCRAFSPIIEEIADEVEHVKICKINTADEAELAAEFNVIGIPTLVFLKEGKVIQMTAGFQSKVDVLQMIKEKTT